MYAMRVTIFSSKMSGMESLGWIFAQGVGVGGRGVPLENVRGGVSHAC